MQQSAEEDDQRGARLTRYHHFIFISLLAFLFLYHLPRDIYLINFAILFLAELILAEKTSFNGVSSFFSHLLALESLDFSDFKKDCEEVLNECKDVAAKRRRQSTRLEHLGIPEEELLRQQQELFARARAAAAEQDLQLQQQMSQSVAAAGQQPASSSAAATGHSGQS